MWCYQGIKEYKNGLMNAQIKMQKLLQMILLFCSLQYISSQLTYLLEEVKMFLICFIDIGQNNAGTLLLQGHKTI